MARKKKDPLIEVVGFSRQSDFDATLATWEKAQEGKSNPFLDECAGAAGGKIFSDSFADKESSK